MKNYNIKRKKKQKNFLRNVVKRCFVLLGYITPIILIIPRINQIIVYNHSRKTFVLVVPQNRSTKLYSNFSKECEQQFAFNVQTIGILAHGFYHQFCPDNIYTFFNKNYKNRLRYLAKSLGIKQRGRNSLFWDLLPNREFLVQFMLFPLDNYIKINHFYRYLYNLPCNKNKRLVLYIKNQSLVIIKDVTITISHIYPIFILTNYKYVLYGNMSIHINYSLSFINILENILNKTELKTKTLTIIYRKFYTNYGYISYDNIMCSEMFLNFNLLETLGFRSSWIIHVFPFTSLKLAFLCNSILAYLIENISNIRNVTINYYLREQDENYPNSFHLASLHYKHSKEDIIRFMKKVQRAKIVINTEEYYKHIEEEFIIIKLFTTKLIKTLPIISVPFLKDNKTVAYITNVSADDDAYDFIIT